MANSKSTLFRDQTIRFGNGIEGIALEIDSANPVNYFDAITDLATIETTQIDGKLFVPEDGTPVAVVIVVPGSLGVAPSHLAHAEALTDHGIAACVIDPFGSRSVTSTVADQTQYSFAASAWDVLATAAHLAARDDIDGARIGAQGHSRGGSAVITAAVEDFAAVFPVSLCAVYAAYPWCGHQFVAPSIGDTVLRAVIGDRDEWCLPQQVQGQIHAMRLTGGKASFRLFAGAQHSFDRGTAVELVEAAAVSPGAPTCYIDHTGAFIHPLTGVADATLMDRELMIYGMKAGYGKRGARIGSEGDQAALFREDMLNFWTGHL